MPSANYYWLLLSDWKLKRLFAFIQCHRLLLINMATINWVTAHHFRVLKKIRLVWLQIKISLIPDVISDCMFVVMSNGSTSKRSFEKLINCIKSSNVGSTNINIDFPHGLDDYIYFKRHISIYQTKFHIWKQNSMVWVRERTIPTERPPLVGEVIANFFADRRCHVVSVTIPTAVFSVFWTGAATFLSSSSSVILTRLSGPR
jgi:hypothetical protein